MDADNLADFGTIKTARGDVKAALCFFSKARYHSIIRISYNVLIHASLFVEYQCIAGQTTLHYLTFLPI